MLHSYSPCLNPDLYLYIYFSDNLMNFWPTGWAETFCRQIHSIVFINFEQQMHRPEMHVCRAILKREIQRSSECLARKM